LSDVADNLDLFDGAPAQPTPRSSASTPDPADASRERRASAPEQEAAEAAQTRSARLGPDAEPVDFPVYTVSQLNRGVRRLLENRVGTLWVSGEVTGWKRYDRTGHCYFGLRDSEAQARAVMFRTDATRLPMDPDEGMEVRVLAEPTLYEARGEFQLVVRALETVGEDGLWRLAFERLRARLDAEGLLAPERKRPLPSCPATVGVVTSASGAALRDMLHVIERRAPWVRVIHRHARVQGEGAALEIADAIRAIVERTNVEVLIVGRGGGSIEDLWAFNEEPVARAIAACAVPVISAVGHETDVTIADLVADARAPTPSAGAERAVPDALDLERRLDGCAGTLRYALSRTLERRRTRQRDLARALRRGVADRLRDRRERTARLAGRLEALSPLGALARGYAVPLAPGGHVLRSAAEFRPGARFELRVRDGSVACDVVDVRREAEEAS